MERMTAIECRQRMSALIRDALPERDPERRQALLVMADHWGELMRQAARRNVETRDLGS